MLKLAGAAMILFAATMFGFYKARGYANRPKQLRQLAAILQRLETEIIYGYTPLSEALARIGKQQQEPLSGLLKLAAEPLTDTASGLTAQESWRIAVQECWPRTAMGPGEKEVMLQLGTTLGITDREDQIKHIRLAVSQLQAEEATAREEQGRYEKMWRSLGLLAGALVILLLY